MAKLKNTLPEINDQVAGMNNLDELMKLRDEEGVHRPVRLEVLAALDARIAVVRTEMAARGERVPALMADVNRPENRPELSEQQIMARLFRGQRIPPPAPAPAPAADAADAPASTEPGNKASLDAIRVAAEENQKLNADNLKAAARSRKE